jgi:hypothetical protein
VAAGHGGWAGGVAPHAARQATVIALWARLGSLEAWDAAYSCRPGWDLLRSDAGGGLAVDEARGRGRQRFRDGIIEDRTLFGRCGLRG